MILVSTKKKHNRSPDHDLLQVDRYVTWPGQATGYKIGQLKIRELRTRAETKLGVGFNIKDFHQVGDE